MTTIDDRLLNGLVFGVTVLLGLVLLPARLAVRALAVGAAVIGLVLAGVFLPTFSMQILGGVLACGGVRRRGALDGGVCGLPAPRMPGDCAAARRANHEPGVDLSQYQPDPPLPELPAPPSPPVEPPKTDSQEGGQSNA